jgi:hypothetical protein
LTGFYVAKPDVFWHLAEERNSLTDQDWNTRNYQTIDQTGRKELLYSHAAIDVEIAGTSIGEFGNDFGRRAGHLLDIALDRYKVDRAAAKDNYTLVTIGPFAKRQDLFKRSAADDKRVDNRHKLFVSVWLTPALRQEIQIVIRSCDKPVNTCPNKNRYCHSAIIPEIELNYGTRVEHTI